MTFLSIFRRNEFFFSHIGPFYTYSYGILFAKYTVNSSNISVKGLDMTKIAIPLNSTMGFYHSNPVTAPKFAIYTINMKTKNTTFSLLHVIDNPLDRANDGKYASTQILCNCDKDTCSDIYHRAEHFILLDAIHDCKYLLANNYCKNTVHALKIANIQTYKISPFIKQVDMAINNFILGVSLASKVNYIHHAS